MPRRAIMWGGPGEQEYQVRVALLCVLTFFHIRTKTSEIPNFRIRELSNFQISEFQEFENSRIREFRKSEFRKFELQKFENSKIRELPHLGK